MSYQHPKILVCKCKLDVDGKPCFRVIPANSRLCTACSQGYYGPGGSHGYGAGK